MYVLCFTVGKFNECIKRVYTTQCHAKKKRKKYLRPRGSWNFACSPIFLSDQNACDTEYIIHATPTHEILHEHCKYCHAR